MLRKIAIKLRNILHSQVKFVGCREFSIVIHEPLWRHYQNSENIKEMSPHLRNIQRYKNSFFIWFWFHVTFIRFQVKPTFWSVSMLVRRLNAGHDGDPSMILATMHICGWPALSILSQNKKYKTRSPALTSIQSPFEPLDFFMLGQFVFKKWTIKFNETKKNNFLGGLKKQVTLQEIICNCIYLKESHGKFCWI